jgi:homeobox domain-containing protein
MSHASLERNLPSPRAAAQLPYVRAPPASSSVPHDIPAETPELTVKRRMRPDARQLEALNGMFCRTTKPSTELQLQLANKLNMSLQRVQNWLAHIFVYMYYS